MHIRFQSRKGKTIDSLLSCFVMVFKIVMVNCRSFPWHLEVQMEEGDIEIFVGRN